MQDQHLGRLLHKDDGFANCELLPHSISPELKCDMLIIMEYTLVTRLPTEYLFTHTFPIPEAYLIQFHPTNTKNQYRSPAGTSNPMNMHTIMKKSRATKSWGLFFEETDSLGH